MPRMTLVTTAVLVALGACAPPAPAGDYDAVVAEFLEAEQFNGVVLVARDDSVLLARAVGMADHEAGVPTRLDTRYQLGSIAKWVTTLVVLALVDDGVLSLDAPIATYLPGHRADVAGRVTVHHLLSHTSGVPNDLVAAYQADPAQLSEVLPTREAVRRHASGALQFDPGTRFDYSHSNWILVQGIIESVTGEPFGMALERVLLDPLGLDDTGVFAAGDPVFTTIAPGYESLSPAPVRADLPAPTWLATAGGIYSTGPDLLRLVTAVYRGDVLSDSLRARLDRVVTPEADLSDADTPGGYALGGRIRAMPGDGGMVLWHTGSNGPSKVRLSRELATGLTVITLVNDDADHERTGELVESVLAMRPE